MQFRYQTMTKILEKHGDFHLGMTVFFLQCRAYVDHAIADLCYVGPVLAMIGAACSIYR